MGVSGGFRGLFLTFAGVIRGLHDVVWSWLDRTPETPRNPHPSTGPPGSAHNAGHSRPRFTCLRQYLNLGDKVGQTNHEGQTLPHKELQMNVFEIEPLGLTPADLERVAEQIDVFARRGPDFVLHYRSAERRLLLVVQHEGGKVVDWMLMPCATEADAPGLLSWWLEQASDDVREREADAQAAAALVINSIREPRH